MSFSKPEYDFSGEVAIVTGGGSGIGEEVARSFASARAAVMVADANGESAGEVARSIIEAGGRAAHLVVDVSQSDAVAAMVQETVETFGSVTLACNSAGIDIEHAAIADADDGTFQKVLDVNLLGTFNSLKFQIRQMVKQGRGGAIVNIASTAALRNTRDTNPGYVVSKAAVVAMSRAAGLAYGPNNIRVNAVAPGAIDTPMFRAFMPGDEAAVAAFGKKAGVLGRVGTPADVAQAVLWLCSGGSDFTVGHLLTSDGGISMR